MFLPVPKAPSPWEGRHCIIHFRYKQITVFTNVFRGQSVPPINHFHCIHKTLLQVFGDEARTQGRGFRCGHEPFFGEFPGKKNKIMVRKTSQEVVGFNYQCEKKFLESTCPWTSEFGNLFVRINVSLVQNGQRLGPLESSSSPTYFTFSHIFYDTANVSER